MDYQMQNEPRQGGEHNRGSMLTPAELVSSPIRTSLFGGYSKLQVDLLLEQAAEQLETLLQENRELKRKLSELDHSVAKYQNLESALQNTLVSSQKMGENMITAAKLQADALLEEARLARSRAVFKMEVLPDALRSEIQRLMELRERMRDDLASLLESHRKMIERIPKAESASEEFVRKEAERLSRQGNDSTLEGRDTPAPLKIEQEYAHDMDEGHGYVNL